MSMNGIFGVASLANVSGASTIDTEHQRIMRELRALGIEPSGDKASDKAKLERVQSSKNTQSAQKETAVQPNKTFGEAIEEQANIDINETVNASAMTGATQISELNKLRFLGGI